MKETGYEEKLNKHFRPLLKQYGASHKSVNWGSAASQRLRFEVLLSFGPEPGQSILDLGCGVGHLYSHIKEVYPHLQYTGIDLVSEMVEQARISFPDGCFEHQDIMDKSFKRSFDAVVASGIFYIGCDYDRMFAQIEAMWKAADYAIAFNSLSSWASEKDEGEFYADPLKVVEYCRSLSTRVVLRHDYMPHDFTILVLRPRSRTLEEQES